MKKDTTKKATATEKKATATTTLDVANVLKNLKYDTTRFEIIRVYDNEEFLAVKKADRKSYANIRETGTKRSVIKLWGHKDFVTVECSKMLRKKEQINVEKKVYTEKEKDTNNNYKCATTATATVLANDFLKQVDSMLTATATEKTAEAEVSA